MPSPATGDYAGQEPSKEVRSPGPLPSLRYWHRYDLQLQWPLQKCTSVTFCWAMGQSWSQYRESAAVPPASGSPAERATEFADIVQRFALRRVAHLPTEWSSEAELERYVPRDEDYTRTWCARRDNLQLLGPALSQPLMHLALTPAPFVSQAFWLEALALLNCNRAAVARLTAELSPASAPSPHSVLPMFDADLGQRALQLKRMHTTLKDTLDAKFTVSTLPASAAAAGNKAAPLPALIPARHNVIDFLLLMVDLLQSLKCVHDAGWIHQDIKPANVLQSDPKAQRTLLCDFSIASLQTRVSPRRRSLTSPAYRAPEQFAFLGYDQSADVWSLGATLFEYWSPARLTARHLNYIQQWASLLHVPRKAAGQHHRANKASKDADSPQRLALQFPDVQSSLVFPGGSRGRLASQKQDAAQWHAWLGAHQQKQRQTQQQQQQQQQQKDAADGMPPRAPQAAARSPVPGCDAAIWTVLSQLRTTDLRPLIYDEICRLHLHFVPAMLNTMVPIAAIRHLLARMLDPVPSRRPSVDTLLADALQLYQELMRASKNIVDWNVPLPTNASILPIFMRMRQPWALRTQTTQPSDLFKNPQHYVSDANVPRQDLSFYYLPTMLVSTAATRVLSRPQDSMARMWQYHQRIRTAGLQDAAQSLTGGMVAHVSQERALVADVPLADQHLAQVRAIPATRPHAVPQKGVLVQVRHTWDTTQLVLLQLLVHVLFVAWSLAAGGVLWGASQCRHHATTAGAWVAARCRPAIGFFRRVVLRRTAADADSVAARTNGPHTQRRPPGAAAPHPNGAIREIWVVHQFSTSRTHRLDVLDSRHRSWSGLVDTMRKTLLPSPVQLVLAADRALFGTGGCIGDPLAAPSGSGSALSATTLNARVWHGVQDRYKFGRMVAMVHDMTRLYGQKLTLPLRQERLVPRSGAAVTGKASPFLYTRWTMDHQDLMHVLWSALIDDHIPNTIMQVQQSTADHWQHMVSHAMVTASLYYGTAASDQPKTKHAAYESLRASNHCVVSCLHTLLTSTATPPDHAKQGARESAESQIVYYALSLIYWMAAVRTVTLLLDTTTLSTQELEDFFMAGSAWYMRRRTAVDQPTPLIKVVGSLFMQRAVDHATFDIAQWILGSYASHNADSRGPMTQRVHALLWHNTRQTQEA